MDAETPTPSFVTCAHMPSISQADDGGGGGGARADADISVIASTASLPMTPTDQPNH